jgi:hypothetical protein
MSSPYTKPVIIGASAVGTNSVARWLNGASGSLSSSQMLMVGVTGAVVASSYVAPTVTAMVYSGRAGAGLVEALVSGVVAAGILYATTGDSSVSMHVPVQALAHIGGSWITRMYAAPAYPAAAAPQNEEHVVQMAHATR